MPLTLTWKGTTRLPIQGDILRPDSLAGHTPGSAAHVMIPMGNTQVPLGDLFAVKGSIEDSSLILEGDLRSVKRVARGMNGGSILVRGNCGESLGQGMHSGSIVVEGSAGDSCGMGMRGGVIHIKGSTGNNLGGSEPGARLGMRDGMIVVEGSIGNDAGLAMRRGLIAVLGDCGDTPGRGMIAGSIFLFGSVGIHAGLGMKRGTIAMFGGTPKLAPGFASGGDDRPTFLTIYLKRLRELGFPVPIAAFAGSLARYNGDRAEGGQGEILARASA